MTQILPYLVDAALFYFLFGHSLVRRFAPRRYRVRWRLKDYERVLRRRCDFDRDRLTAQEAATLEERIRELRTARRTACVADREACLAGIETEASALIPPRKGGWVREYFEVFVVVLAIVFGFRTLFLQPFKIPTGSMQPTLFGIHFERTKPEDIPGAAGRFFGYLNQSRRYVYTTIEKAGYLERIYPAPPPEPVPGFRLGIVRFFFPATVIQIEGVKYILPGAPENVRKYCDKVYRYLMLGGPETQGGLYFEKGEVLACGYLELGDHLFVDRTRFDFTEPRRGDITVFLTDGIRDTDGTSLEGRYYIKRLVGLPGDELRIRDHRLYLRKPGEDRFALVDASIRPGFERMYTFKGGYRGYSHFPGSTYLKTNNDTFKVPEDSYFMLGDNSENSKDSRFWGTVPRRNLVGRAFLVWWPFTRRWGLVDRAAPLPFPTPPTMK
ncbi:MAG: signal peptidase I [Kiritimatiellaeota bacterium]|nr:signal peptidase I [Kiritimatiellota bacterium]